MIDRVLKDYAATDKVAADVYFWDKKSQLCLKKRLHTIVGSGLDMGLSPEREPPTQDVNYRA